MTDLEKSNNINLEVDMNDETRIGLIKMFIDETFTTGSRELFTARLEATGSIETAAYDALLNEGVVSAIVEALKKQDKLDEDYVPE